MSVLFFSFPAKVMLMIVDAQPLSLLLALQLQLVMLQEPKQRRHRKQGLGQKVSFLNVSFGLSFRRIPIINEMIDTSQDLDSCKL